MVDMLSVIFMFVFVPADCSFLQTAVDHDYPGKSLGRINGLEVYEYEGHEYSFHLEPETWEEAVAVCRREGAYLAMLEDPFEVEFIGNAMDGNLCSNTVFQNVWIGARLFPESGRWLWDATGYEVIGDTGSNTKIQHNGVVFPPWNLVTKANHDCLSLQQDLSHRPKFTNLECHRKRRFLCEKGCGKLYDTDRGVWSPDSCLLDPSVEGDRCHMMCQAGLELDGASPLTCTRAGWNNSIGINVIPDCRGPAEIAKDLTGELLHYSVDEETLIIYIVDEAVNKEVFKYEITLVQHLVQLIPPSESRLVAVMGNGEVPHFILPPGAWSYCQMHEKFSKITYKESQNSNLGMALRSVYQLLVQNNSSIQAEKTVVFIVTGKNQTGTGARRAATAIKAAGGVIMVTGVGSFDRDELITIATTTWDGPLFFGLVDVTNLVKVLERIEAVSVSSNDGSCHIDGPGIFLKDLKELAANNTSLLYLLDLTGDAELLARSLALVQALTSSFPLTRYRRAGLITLDAHPKLEVPLTTEDTCFFFRHVAKIAFHTKNCSDVSTPYNEAVTLARYEAKHNLNSKTLPVIISTQDCSPFKEALHDDFEDIACVQLNAPSSTQEQRLRRLSIQLESSNEIEDMIGRVAVRKYIEDCKAGCGQLPGDMRGFWKGDGVDCSGPGQPGRRCSLMCQNAFELVGSNPVICTEYGWTATSSDDVTPSCLTPEEIAVKFMNKLKTTLENTVDTNLLFVLDESGSVTLPNFRMEIDFVAAVVDAFPLSSRRTAGIALFSDSVRIVIAATATDTCRFIRASRRVRYRGGETDISKALTRARQEILSRATNPQNLVFLITDGISQTDPVEAAMALRNDGTVLFVIGVANYEQEQLEPLASIGPDGTSNFFGVKSFRVFKVIAEYLNTTYKAEGVDCSNS